MFKRPQVNPGNWTVVCDRTGFRLLNTQVQFEWNGLLVFDRVWEIRQPQDYLKGIPDNMSVPYARPKEEPTFITRQITPGEL